MRGRPQRPQPSFIAGTIGHRAAIESNLTGWAPSSPMLRCCRPSSRSRCAVRERGPHLLAVYYVFVAVPHGATLLTIQFEAPCRYFRDGRNATTNIRPVDAIASPMVADLYVCKAHLERLVARARAKNLKVSMLWPPDD